jgi:ATP-dependent helicase YprA (DUF1998 family)
MDLAERLARTARHSRAGHTGNSRYRADVIIAAATAGGKTEAAFLPIISRVAEASGRGFKVISYGQKIETAEKPVGDATSVAVPEAAH